MYLRLVPCIFLRLGSCADKMVDDIPSSLKTNESVCTRSQNLYISQHTSTGTLYDLATRATWELPTRDIT